MVARCCWVAMSSGVGAKMRGSWRRGHVGAVAGLWLVGKGRSAIGDMGPDAAGVLKKKGGGGGCTSPAAGCQWRFGWQYP